MISIVMLQFNNARLTIEAVTSLKEHHIADHELIIVDNASTDGSADACRMAFPQIHLIEAKKNGGYGYGNNLGARMAKGDIVLFLNNDVECHEDILSPLATHFKINNHCAIAGLKLQNKDGSIQSSTGRFPSVWNEWLMKRERISELAQVRNVDWVTGAALAIRKEVFDAVGGFDESYFMYFDDIDLCRRVNNLGWTTHALPSPTIVHFGGGSQPGGLSPRIQVEYRRSQLRYYSQHCSRTQLFMLRVYLTRKYGGRKGSGDKKLALAAREIMRLVKDS
ncbi:MAG TPA: glycosyltransferase family 2 protein [Bacteroidota bacterium]